MAKGKREFAKPGKRGLLSRLAGLGFTNCLAIFLVALLFAGLAGGFYLAVLSIRHQYTGALACWTVVFTPIGTALSLVLARIVDKSRAENTGADGEGIKYAAAKAVGFQQGSTKQDTAEAYSVDSPPI